MTWGGGPPASHTGSPGDNGITCNTNGCHTGMATTPAIGWITSTVPLTGYVPGQIYTISATATQAGCIKFGFQISPQSLTGTYLGTLVVTSPTLTQIVGTKYIEQKAAGTVGSSGFHTWTFDWIAPAAGTGDVTFYGAFNCSNSNNSASGDHIYTSTLLVSPCNLSTTINANGPTVFCPGGSVALDAGSGFNSYLWSNGATTQTISVAIAGVYSVTVTDVSGCIAVAASPNVIVNSAPAVPVITPSGATTFCEGENVNLSATAGATSYLWSTGETTQSINVTGSGNYNITITNATGCSASSLTTVVTVYQLPNLSILGSSTICPGSNTILDAGSGYSNYSWSNGATTQTISVSTAAIFSVTVTVSNGCTASASLTTTIGSTLTPTINASGSDTICQGSSITLDAGSGFNTYNWSNGNTTQTIIVNTAGTFSVDVSDVNGCTGISNSVITTVADTPVCSINVVPSNVCSGQSLIASATGDTLWTYEWNPGAVTGMSVSLFPAISTTYTMTATTLNNCTTSVSVLVNVIPAPPIPVITQAGAILTANSTIALTYQWNFNGNIINGATNANYDAGQQTGSYTVIIADSSACESQSLPFNYLGSGISLLANSVPVIFPNPFIDFISVENLNSENEIELLNVEGEIIFRKTVASKNEIINTSALSAGIYLLKLKSQREIIYKVVVKN